jgi:predicted alpha-1,2-mannosidase
MIYLYNHIGQPWKTQARAREVMARLYQSTPDGFCGDEDTGQMSAWYVFSAMGFYPMCPGTTEYLIGSPLFDKATITLPDGKKFIINTRNNGPQRPYIGDGFFNGKSFDRTYIKHEEIVKGGELLFDMRPTTDHKWATAPEGLPASAMSELRKSD